MFVGVGPGRVRDMFEMAQKKSPCILFIDQIGLLGKNEAVASLLEDILTMNRKIRSINYSWRLMVSTEEANVVVIAETNRSDVLDPHLCGLDALIDKFLFLSRISRRASIFRVHLKPIKTSLDKVQLSRKLAAHISGFSCLFFKKIFLIDFGLGTDVANVCNEDALIAARDAHDEVTAKDFKKAFERGEGTGVVRHSFAAVAEFDFDVFIF
ncbi:unnamed protein product [Meloidogyne enterolobii]|uniref:Uncharacterized protein n=1 Tax=Meloidogyne enterolobii TaxID=390850 RepID=A0ACB1ATG8_MELEN